MGLPATRLTGTLFPGMRRIDCEDLSIEFALIQACHGFLGSTRYVYKPKAFEAPSLTVCNQSNSLNFSISFEEILYLICSCRRRKVANIDSR